ncbi:MAG: hypothetical protein C0608_00495 [Deltaproteobacteria bacterium]|nr:MAG: hypothetical protein C0608_00495 [Deltaproteobacteria bacterium]
MSNNPHRRFKSSPKRRYLPLAIAVLLGLGIGLWTSHLLEVRAKEQGEELSQTVISLVGQAAKLKETRELDEARNLLKAALKMMEPAPELHQSEPYINVLTSLAALELSESSPEEEGVAQAIQYLEDAWKYSSGAKDKIRATIAKERAFAELLSANMDDAILWLNRAADLDPDEEEVVKQVEVVERYKSWRERIKR